MLAPNKKSAPANKNTELSARLKVAEEQLRLLREENQRLKVLEQSHLSTFTLFEVPPITHFEVRSCSRSRRL